MKWMRLKCRKAEMCEGQISAQLLAWNRYVPKS